ncbi:SusC/RagA family TonB-linked outer membrane protein [Pedobacter sp. ISL-68]|uniref:SusC/RagA family TonB-linked outer membrane protein n=1 Tax=unclassified Pedobacter TaxID=2628915 RepID=UPI001BE6A094|nr:MULTISPECIES: SusC/RagA family TonB-linked outer membrane protein [unclassified Pedobacter]MBT2560088.1 SusC/RagA family TonB-linked outer membrane protein [Pedobacter sp. ISL-64]MBT2589067.1 SusC/RagA family TonB-linked outer membrane protein [Pedobacter sp. ISL-68]
MRITIYILLILFSVSLNANSQTVRGRVTSKADNLPLAGVLITVKDNINKSVTDSFGHFSIDLVEGDYSLVLHLLGYNDLIVNVKVPLKETLEVQLASRIMNLNEVTVSTGYQTLSKERATGSFTVINRQQLEQQISTNILDRLEAVAGGLVINKSQTDQGAIMIRGLSSIVGPKSPLVILNNFPYEGDLGNINPNDVESISILKDAAAASIWGTRAGNGVIVITTKKAHYNQPLKVSLSSNVSLQGRPDLFYMPLISSNDFIEVEKMLYGKGYYRSRINTLGSPLSPVVEMLVRHDNNQLSAEEMEQRIGYLETIDVRNEYDKLVYKTGINTQHALSMSGGSEYYNWRIMGGYDNNRTTLKEQMERITTGFENSIHLFKNLTVISSLRYTQQNTAMGKQGYGSFASAYNELYPYAILQNPDGSSAPFYQYRQPYLETAGGGKLLDWKYYPLEDYRNLDQKSRLQDILLNLDLNYNVGNGISISAKYQYENQNVEGTSLKDKNSYFARDVVNSFTQIDKDGNVLYIVPKGGILDKDYSRTNSNQIRGQINFDQTFGDHELHALAGAEFRNNVNSRALSKNYGFNDDLLTFGNVDFTRTYPNFITGRNAFVPSSGTMYQTQLYYLSNFFNMAYTYKNRYTLSASARQDATNLFGVNTNDKWNPLWSAGLSWQISKESFYNINSLPLLKLRATYGFSGNADPSRSAVTTILYGANSPYTQTPYATFSQFGNPELKWETIRTINFALDFGSKNSRISGSLEYFKKKGTDLLGNSPLDPTTGSGLNLLKNAASMKGNGVDIEIRAINFNGRFKWLTNLNLSRYKDRVTDYYLSSIRASNFMTSAIGITGKVGLPVYSILSYKWAGLDPSTGDPQGYLNGVVNKNYATLTGATATIDDLTYWGSAIPTYYGNLGNTFSWQGLSLSIALSYKLGYFFRRQSIEYNGLYTNGKGHKDFAERWQNPGDEKWTSIPSLVYPAPTNRENFYKYSGALIEKGDHVRIQYINIEYSPKLSFLARLKISDFNLYANMSNVGLLWTANKKNIDPDYSRNLTSLPPSKTISLGLRAGF